VTKINSGLAYDKLAYFRLAVSLVVGLFLLSSQSYAQAEGRFTVQGLPGNYSTLSQAESALKAIDTLHSELKKDYRELVSKSVVYHHYDVADVEPSASAPRFRVERLHYNGQYFDSAQTALDVRGAEVYPPSASCPANYYQPAGDFNACDAYTTLELTPSGGGKSVTAANKQGYFAFRHVEPTCEAGRDGLTLHRETILTCPSGYQRVIRHRCSFDCGNAATGTIIEQVEGKEDGCSANNTDNPCNVSTGNKYRHETDISSNTLSLIRTYNSNNLVDLGFGRGWKSNFQNLLIVGVDVLRPESSTGRSEPWEKINGVWQGDADSDLLITEVTDGFLLTKTNGALEHYNLAGQLSSQTDTNGQQTLYEYNDDNQLINVTHHYGNKISFTYLNGNIATVTDAFGSVYAYEYLNGNLVAVVFPDTTPNNANDNPRKIYHYEDANYPNHLTGITDENGNRYATFAYNANGQAILSELGTTSNAAGQGKIELNFQAGAQ
jgi:YD repeat-containing protein